MIKNALSYEMFVKILKGIFESDGSYVFGKWSLYEIE